MIPLLALPLAYGAMPVAREAAQIRAELVRTPEFLILKVDAPTAFDHAELIVDGRSRGPMFLTTSSTGAQRMLHRLLEPSLPGRGDIQIQAENVKGQRITFQISKQP